MDTISKVNKWVKEVGQNEAYIRLLRADLSRSTCEKLVSGLYTSNPGPLVTSAINKAMKVKKGI